MLRSRRARLVVAVCVGALAAPFELAIKCRGTSDATALGSEGCLWARAWLPATVPAYLLLVVGFTYGALSLVAWLRRRAPDA